MVDGDNTGLHIMNTSAMPGVLPTGAAAVCATAVPTGLVLAHAVLLAAGIWLTRQGVFVPPRQALPGRARRTHRSRYVRLVQYRGVRKGGAPFRGEVSKFPSQECVVHPLRRHSKLSRQVGPVDPGWRVKGMRPLWF
jgi:hypothetical protein